MSEFPHAGAGTLHPELFLRDIEFLNYHINHDKWDWFRNHDIIDAVRWQDDFLFNEADLYTEAASGGGAAVYGDGVNGYVILTPHTDNDDYDEIAQDQDVWQLVDGYPLYFEARFKVADADDCDFYIGLINSAGYFSAAPQDGVYFLLTDGDTELQFVVRQNGTPTAVDTGVNLTDLGWVRVAFHWDGEGTIRWFIFTDGDAPQVCEATGSVATGYAQDEDFAFAAGVRNGSAASRVAYIDYWKCAMRRVIE